MKIKNVLIGSVIGLILIGLLAVVPVTYYSSVEVVTITVTDKQRNIDGEGSAYYLVFTENEVFKNTDSKLLFLKWNSSDIQGQLRIDETYDVKVAGWRVPFFSMYRNIISIQ